MDLCSSNEEITEAIILVLSPGEKTDIFIDRALDGIDANRRGSYQINNSRHPNEKKVAEQLIDKISALEVAIDELLPKLKRPIFSGRLALSMNNPLRLKPAMEELEKLRLVLEEELPKLDRLSKPAANKSPRIAFIVELMVAYESIFKKRAGHGRDARFHRAMKVILTAAGYPINDPMAWIIEARASGMVCTSHFVQ